MYNIFQKIIDYFAESRLRVIAGLMIMFTCILLTRLFVLQIVRGQSYQENYNLKLEKETSIDATRGNIYDRNGKLIAYSKLSYAVTIEDSGSYSGETVDGEYLNATQVKNRELNKVIASVIENLEKNGDSIDNDFKIYINGAGEYEFSVTGTTLQRFRADIFGHASITDLEYNETYDVEEETATADEIMEYLCTRFGISEDYSKDIQYKVAIIRYNISLNSFTKYMSTKIASDVSDETVAYVKENSSNLTGVEIKESSIRQYNDAEAFSSVIGYTGTISTEEYNEKSKDDDTVSLTDQVGKTGIESAMDDYLTGTKGTETLYVDSVGTILQVGEHKDAVSGDDVYLSIDYDLQVNTYKLLERQLAGIILKRLTDMKTYDNDNDATSTTEAIASYDVYTALINNHILDDDALHGENATELSTQVYNTFVSHKQTSLSTINNYLSNENVVYSSLPDEYQDVATYIVKKLKSEGVFDATLIDNTDDMQVLWTSESLSINDYLAYAIDQNWIDITKISSAVKYVDAEEAYQALVAYIMEGLQDDSDYDAIVYQYAILNDEIAPAQLCALLYDQNVLDADDATREGLLDGSISAYSFINDKISSLELTPSMLGLDPCSASSVVLDSNTGAVLASVSYPGYDSNRLANSTDSSYYVYLNQNSSRPLYNYATQQKTAPGSTYKPMMVTAGLAEGVVTTATEITDEGIYDKVSNQPRCWIYNTSGTTHGTINVSEALRDSCNYYFYEVGYRLASMNSGSYSDADGIEKLTKYASAYGLDSKTGVEIAEATSTVATEYPVMAAIGQSDNNITTIALARYATAVTNGGSVYDLTLLDHVADKNGNVIASYAPKLVNTVDSLDQSQWDAIHTGMRMVVESMSEFDGFSVNIAGKTGTAQSSLTRPSHALFIGYAPYDNPEITVATRIAYGYNSHYAANVTKHIIGTYYNDAESIELTEGGAMSVNTTNFSD